MEPTHWDKRHSTIFPFDFFLRVIMLWLDYFILMMVGALIVAIKSSGVPVESTLRIMQLWENCWAQSFRCNVHPNSADMLVAKEIIGVGILGARSPNSSAMPQDSAVPPQSNMAPGRCLCYFSPVSWALWFISYALRRPMEETSGLTCLH